MTKSSVVLLVDSLPYAYPTVRVLSTAAFGVDIVLRICIEIALSFCETDGTGILKSVDQPVRNGLNRLEFLRFYGAQDTART